jgi:Holliday junction resolvase RusA-like endonuclease
MRVARFTIFGEPSSKANSRRLVTFGGKPRFIKSQDALDYLTLVRCQCTGIHPLLSGDLSFTARIFYKTQRKDLDPSLILDALQGLIYTNDRQIREMHLYHAIDKDNPRAEIEIRERSKG